MTSFTAATRKRPGAPARRYTERSQCHRGVQLVELAPGNRLEALKGERAGQFSIRVNDQFRICFAWTPAGPEHVEITDYH